MQLKQFVAGGVAGLIIGAALTYLPTRAVGADVPVQQGDRVEYDMESAGNGGVYAISRKTGRVYLFENRIMIHIGNIRDFDARGNLRRQAIDGREAE